MPTYWDFNNDKVWGGVKLKADWKIKKVQIRFFDNTEFLKPLYRSGAQNSHLGWPFTISGSTLLFSDTTSRTLTTDPSWAQATLLQGNINFKNTFGMSTDDSIGMNINGGVIGDYLSHIPRSPTGSIPFCQLRQQNGGVSLWTGASYVDTWNKFTAASVNGSDLFYDMFISKGVLPGTYIPFPSPYQIHFTVNRARFIEVDYGTTFQQLANMAKHPTAWKTYDGKTLDWYYTWTRSTDGATWQSLMSQPITQQTTFLVKWK